jgi:hypothetical protein
MSGINIIKKFHGSVSTVSAVWAGTDDTTGVTISTLGYTKLMIHYVTTTGWDRAGNIVCLGALRQDDTFVAPSSTVENATFAVAETDETTFTGGGQYYVVENIAPYVKIVWDNTTAGLAGTLTVTVMPYNE